MKVKKAFSVRVCIGTNCAFRGGLHLLEALEADPQVQKFCVVEGVKCLQETCAAGEQSPVVEINGERIAGATLEQVLAKLMSISSGMRSDA